MKIYRNLDVNLTYQNFGSTWALIMRGKTESIEAATNGLFNWKATSGDVEFHDLAETVGVIWTNEDSMEHFFFCQAENHLLNQIDCEPNSDMEKRIKKVASSISTRKMKCLREYHENFFNFSGSHAPETYGNGKLTAERPDVDMKDSIVDYAFAPLASAA